MTDAPALILKRPRSARALISLVAMIDVLLILLVFFMVTSTYVDLNMIPALSQNDAQNTVADDQSRAQPVLVRIGEDGVAVIRGQAMPPSALDAFLRERLADEPTLAVLILPTGVAKTQALVEVMDTATKAGARHVRVIRLAPRP